jgi:hypothetical protein
MLTPCVEQLMILRHFEVHLKPFMEKYLIELSLKIVTAFVPALMRNRF